MAVNNAQSSECGYKCGPLPDCAPLAVGIVPSQKDDRPQYEAGKALARGTLFPGLDLPLRNIVNDETADVPMAELMAIQFAAHDLSLYLDTHKNDRDAFETYKDLLRLYKEGMTRYVNQYGPVMKSDLADADRYTWLEGPWPWENTGRR